MRKAARHPATPISHQGWRLGASFCSVPIALALARRPNICSEIITGRPTSSVLMMYTRMNAAPPFSPVR